jgi:hypothetical protein
MNPVVWQKSSFSGQASNCVNVADTPTGTVLLRESDEPETVLAATPSALRGLLGVIKRGALDGVPQG